MKINFIYNTEKISVTEKRKINKGIKELTALVSKEEKFKPENINYIFCEDKFIRKINRNYLGHDYETDILTFFDEDESGITEGELLISLDTVKSNSEYFKTDFRNELNRVAVHGLLHLCGYNDTNFSEKKIIRKKEDYYLNKSINAGKNI